MVEYENKNEMNAYGLKVLFPEHQAIGTLEKEYIPAHYGHQVWDASWLLIDYLSQTDGLSGKTIMDLGCGWGLAGIYCAKTWGASVTGVDVDEKVEPYLNLMAAINNVQVDFLNLGFHQIGNEVLNRTDTIIGSDICFSESLINLLYDLIKRVEGSSVKQIIISDPGRWTFDELTKIYTQNSRAEVIDWVITIPYDITGKIFKVDF